MMCMIDVIRELESVYISSVDVKPGAPPIFVPKKIVVGNKKDLRKKRSVGVVSEKDIDKLDGIRIKETSALTN